MNVGTDFRVHQHQQDLIVDRLKGHRNGDRILQLLLLGQFLQHVRDAFLRLVQYHLLLLLALLLPPLLVRALQIELFRILPAKLGRIRLPSPPLGACLFFARRKRKGKVEGRNLNNLSLLACSREYPRNIFSLILRKCEQRGEKCGLWIG